MCINVDAHSDRQPAKRWIQRTRGGKGVEGSSDGYHMHAPFSARNASHRVCTKQALLIDRSTDRLTLFVGWLRMVLECGRLAW